MNDITPPRLPSPQPQQPPQRPLSPPRPRTVSVPTRPIALPQQAPKPLAEDIGAQSPLTLPVAAEPSQIEVERPKKRRLKRLVIAFIVLIVLAAAAAGAGYLWYKDALKPISASSDRVKITVSQGEAADHVAATLQDKKLIKSALALQIYMKVHGKGAIKAGDYVFTASQGPEEIVAWLNDGRVDTFKLTILPGKTLADIKKTFADYGYTNDQIEIALAKTYSGALFDGKPAGTTLEGYIYPETYFVSSDTPLETVLQQGFDEFAKKIDQDGTKQKLAARGMNLYQGITLASIIEQEVSKPQDKKQVSQVFQTRLAQGMMLGSDVTYHYGAALLGVSPSPDVDSPYNTRTHTGLPPGPIGNFNFDALQAVAEPASGDYLFFVAGDDGTTHFAHTNAEHEQNIKNYCQKLCASN